MTAAAHDLEIDAAGSALDVPLAELFDAHCAFVWRSLRHLGVDESALDDAVQDVFLVAYRRWSSFRGASTPRTWLFGIARRVAWRHRRAAHVHASRHVPAAPAHEPSHEPFERVHAMQSLSRMLGRLDRDKRAVFVLAELEGLTAPEVSEALGIPLGTAYSRLRAAWQSLGRSAGREDERLRRTLTFARAAAPKPERRDRMWACIAAGLPALGSKASVGVGAAIVGAAHANAWTVVIVAVGIGLLGAAAVGSRPHQPPASQRAAATVRHDAPSRDAPSRDALSRGEAMPAPTPASDAGPSPTPAAPASRRAIPRPRAGSPAAMPATAPSDPAPDALKQELALVRAAKQALAERRPADALASLSTHARRFPHGQLAADRDALEAAAKKMQAGAIDSRRPDTSAGEEPER